MPQSPPKVAPYHCTGGTAENRCMKCVEAVSQLLGRHYNYGFIVLKLIEQ